MLISFSVTNFLSFRDRTTLNMVANQDDWFRDRLITSESQPDLHCLRGAVIYGANGSGKSNLIKAVEAAVKIVTSGLRVEAPTPFKLDLISHNLPTVFEFIFLLGKIIYIYEFAFLKTHVVSETLAVLLNDDKTVLFTRQMLAYNETKATQYQLNTTTLLKHASSEDRNLIHTSFLICADYKLVLSQLDNEQMMGQISDDFRPKIDAIHYVFEWLTNIFIFVKPNEGTDWGNTISKNLFDSHFEVLPMFDTGIEKVSFEEGKVKFETQHLTKVTILFQTQ